MSELTVALTYTKRLPQANQWVELRFVAFKQTSTIVGIYVLDVESPIKKRDSIINVKGRLFLAGLFISFPPAAKGRMQSFA
jgi:hypothetical protein